VTPGKPLPAANVPAVSDAAPALETPIISDPIKPAVVAEKQPEAEKPAEVVKTDEVKSGPTEVSTAAPVVTEVAAGPTTAPSTQPAEMSAEGPSTQPAKLSAAAEFDKIEAEFVTFSKQPIQEQPLADALTRYEALAADPQLAESLRRVVDVRVATLRTRLEAHNEFMAVKASQDAARERQVAMEAEKAELQERIEKSKVTIYTAVGTLRTSSLQVGPSVLYRLTDPSTGRTLVYLRSSDATYATMIGQFIGVQGNVEVDNTTSLKYITPTATKVVNPTDVGGSVTAHIIPPSILQGTGTATINGQ
jgi:transcription elongation GreA/GreB family factor